MLRDGPGGVAYGRDVFGSEGTGMTGGSAFSNKGFYMAGGTGCSDVLGGYYTLTSSFLVCNGPLLISESRPFELAELV